MKTYKIKDLEAKVTVVEDVESKELDEIIKYTIELQSENWSNK